MNGLDKGNFEFKLEDKVKPHREGHQYQLTTTQVVNPA